VVLGHRIRLRPTAEQEALFRKVCGVARFSWNWALVEWDRQYQAGDKSIEAALRTRLNALKHNWFLWMAAVPKSVPQQPVKNLGRAFASFFSQRAHSPVFRKKARCRDSARFDNGPGTFTCAGKSVKLPLVGKVETTEVLRFTGRPLSAVVSCVAGRWFVFAAVEVERPTPVRESHAADVRIDLGVSTAATLATGGGNS
jgi:putative transposase